MLVVHDEGDLDLGRLELKARRRPRRAQRPALDRATAQDAGLPPAARSASAARSGAIRVRSPTGCSRTSSRTRTPDDARRARRGRGRDDSSRRASSGRSFRSTAASRARAAPRGAPGCRSRPAATRSRRSSSCCELRLASADRTPAGRTAAPCRSACLRSFLPAAVRWRLRTRRSRACGLRSSSSRRSSSSTIATIQLGEMCSRSASAFCASPSLGRDRAEQGELAGLELQRREHLVEAARDRVAEAREHEGDTPERRCLHLDRLRSCARPRAYDTATERFSN